MYNLYKSCQLCPRRCKIDRTNKNGYCGCSDKLIVSRAALHMWEEPCISGNEGSGTVFFGGCSLRCIYCQNRQISDGTGGRIISSERLSEIFLELQEKKANNINLVTPTHYIPHIVQAIESAKIQGLKIPVVYNCGGYENTETIKMLDGYIDIYLPDFKYILSDISKEYSNAFDYPQTAKRAITEMVNQVGKPYITKDGKMKKGVIVRHLLLPYELLNAKMIVSYLYTTYKDNIILSLMNQYTPMPDVKNHSKLCDTVSDKDYNELVEYAINIGVKKAYIQEGRTASESFIPPFDNTGV